MDVEQEILRHGRRIEPQLESLIPRNGPAFLAEPIWYHLDTGGKRIRPALCLLTCELLGGDSEQALPFAAAVELLHNMLLLHDDIADGDVVRRDRPTVWKKYGVGNGVNAGDYLLGVALQAVRATPAPEAVRAQLLDHFLATYLRTVEGQALDINARCDAGFTVEEYLRITTLKTGHYLVLGMVGGAVLADAPQVTLRCLQELGQSMGPAFQIQDDLIDLVGGKGRGGEIGCDIREGKASILYARALACAAPDDAARLRTIMAKPRESTTDADVQWVVDLYRRCRAFEFARDAADRLIAQAHAALDALPIEQQPALRELAAYMVERTR